MTNKSRSQPRGYSLYFVKQVEQANPELLGVKLAKACIDKDVPAAYVAQALGVSKQAVYAWFVGRFQPNGTLTPKVEALLAEYTGATTV